MKLYRIFAIVERDMRKFLRSPALMMTSMVFPLMQLIVLGYAFGGQIKNVPLAVVDEDNGNEALQVRQHLNAVTQGPQTFRVDDYRSLSDAMIDLRSGLVKAILYIPPDYSSRVLRNEKPRLAFIEDNTDSFTASGMFERIQQIQGDLNGPILPPIQPGASLGSASSTVFSPYRLPAQIDIQTVEVYPYVAYIKYLLSGVISLSVFVVAMIGGGITFIDDKARGLHEGYLTTPIGKADLILGLTFAGAIKGVMAGLTITMIGGLIAGIDHLWDPLRIVYLIVVLTVTSLAMISFMFLAMVRVNDPLVPRAIFGVLNTLLYFPSGAIYPVQGFPAWLRWISVIDPFYYCVHALKNLLLKNTGIEGIYTDVLVLLGFFLVLTTASITLFKRQI